MKLIVMKKELIKKFKPRFENYFQNKSFSFEKGIDTFLTIVDEHSLIDKALTKRFEENFNDKDLEQVRYNLATQSETFLKGIFDLSKVKMEGRGMFAACLKKFFRDKLGLNNNIISDFFDKDKNHKPIFQKEYFKNKMIFGDKIKFLYDERNNIHKSEKEKKKYSIDNDFFQKDISDFISVYLLITFEYSEEINKAFPFEYNFINYAEKVVNEFDEFVKKNIPFIKKEFMPIDNLKEELKLTQDMKFIQSDIKGNFGEIRKKIAKNKIGFTALGVAGVGKSTALMYLTRQDAKKLKKYLEKNKGKMPEKRSIPVLLEMKGLIDKKKSLKDYLSENLQIKTGKIEKLLKMGLFSFIFDGINEISDDFYKIRLEEIKDLLKNYKKNFFIFSSRAQDGNPFDKKEIPTFDMLLMTNELMNKFIRKNASPETEKLIKNKLKEKPKFKDIIRTPLLLVQLIQVVEVNKKIPPENDTMIMKTFINCIFKREYKEKHNRKFNKEGSKKYYRALRNLAYETSEISEENLLISEEKARNFIKKHQENEKSYFDIDNFIYKMINLNLLRQPKNSEEICFAQDYFQAILADEEENIILGLI